MQDWAGTVVGLLDHVSQPIDDGPITLPVMPESVGRISALMDRAEVPNSELGHLIEQDAALASKLLRHVNSPLHALVVPIKSVSHAIAALGLQRTRTLVLTSALQNALRARTSRVPIRRLQIEAVERALFAKATAKQLDFDPEVSYMAGLLQDILLPLFLERFPDVYRQRADLRVSLDDFERRQFGVDHATLAAQAMKSWGFPLEITAAVLLHHRLDLVLLEPGLWQTPAVAAVAAAAIPDTLCQSPAGVSALLQLQDRFAGFCFLEVAADVDDKSGRDAGEKETLCRRLGDQVEAQLEQRRQATLHETRHLGNYTLKRQLGQGGMGDVYLAQHDRLKRPAAVKVLRVNGNDPQAIELFEQEVQLTAQLTSPNTIGIYDYGVSPEGLFYYVMEYVDGVTLAELVAADGPSPEGRVLHILTQACNSLAEAHACGLIHRDVKPENIMLMHRGPSADAVKVLDFGLADIVDRTAQSSSKPCVVGTPMYMSPEAITAPGEADARSDLYSLGAVAYFLLTGSTLFSGTTINSVIQQQLAADPEPPSERLDEPVCPNLEEIVMRCLSKQADQRPASAEELQHALQTCRAFGTWTPELASDWWQNHNPQDAAVSQPTDGLGRSTRIVPSIGISSHLAADTLTHVHVT